MATYFHGGGGGGGSEIQAADGTLQTLYLMNPNFLGYSDNNNNTQQQQQQQHHPHNSNSNNTNNMFLLNSASANALSHGGATHAPPQGQHFFGVPLPAAAASIRSQHEIPTLQGVAAPRYQYNLWSATAAASDSPAAVQNHLSHMSADVTSQLGFRRPAQQGLSLSLSPQQPAYRPVHLQPEHGITVAAPPSTVISPRSCGGGGDDVRGSPSSVSAVSNGIPGVQSVMLGSKYLKAAQQLLDEVVNVGKGIKSPSDTAELRKEKVKISREPAAAVAGEGSSGGDSSTKMGGGSSTELTTAQRQELQMKKAKLINMLDEVEQRYRQYHHQMQIVATTFEQVAGMGSAKSYTALALQTISKQFRCLKDAIAAQIKATGKSLGEEDCSGGKIEAAGSRLKFVDHQIRQQRAFQQLGMIQHNAWRPQRGLPERAVSVLRAWLFEHFLHPYPKDSDKHMLAKQTGLTRSQVSNWFINARVRLWKPMVEEMYSEEMKDQQQQNGSEDNNNNNNNKIKPNDHEIGSKSTTNAQQESNTFQMDHPITTTTLQSNLEKPTNHNASPTDQISNSTNSTSHFTMVGSSSDMQWIVQRSPKKQKNPEFHQISLSGMLNNKGVNDHEKQSIQTTIGHNGSGFGGYPIGDIGRFDPTEHLGTSFHGNSVSLTLGLPHCENLSLSGAQHSYLPTQNIQLGSELEMGNVDAHYNSHSSVDFENLNIQNRKRFAAPLLPDFVA